MWTEKKFALSVATLLLLLVKENISIKVLRSDVSLEDEGLSISGARIDDDRRVDIQDVTFCIRFNYKLLGRWEQRSQLIHIEDWRPEPMDPAFQLLNFGANFPFSFFGFGNPKREGSWKSFVLRDPETGEFEVWATNRWSHVCLSYRKRDGHIRVVKDGKTMNINFSDEGLTDVVIPPDFLSKTYLGRCSFDYKVACSSPEGQIADFNVWDRPLTEEEAKDWTTCRSTAKGSVVNWDTVGLELENMSEVDVSMESVCVPPRPGHVIMPMKRNFSAHRDVCSKFKGVASVIRDAETQKNMNEEMKLYPACGNSNDPDSGRYWAGWYDEPTEGQYEDANSGSPLTKQMFQAWYLGEPNGDTLENCAMVWIARNAWNDVSCSHQYCSFCEFEEAPDIQIQGLCSSSKFDTKYSWTRKMVDGRHSFRGYSGTMLTFNRTEGAWTLQPHKDNGVFATTNGTEYPFGKQVWEIIGDPCYEEEGQEEEGASSLVTLNINACNTTEFNCDDGYCIGISSRCDGKVDCPDKTDEIGCEILSTDQSYLKEVPPPSSIPGQLAGVFVSLDILQILEITEVQNTITIQYELRLTWNDRRLTLSNLKTDKDLNTLIPYFRSKIWIPEIVFYNTQTKMESLNDEKAFATISRMGSFKQSPRSELENAYIFKGSENPLTISRIYDAEFLCDFNMATFPFDTQQCSIIMTMKGNTGKFIHLVGEELKYSGPIDLTQYFIKKVGMKNHTVSLNREAIEVNIIFGRRVLATILTTYLPTGLLCIVCFSTNYFKAFFFEAIVTVNLTSLLVLTTLFISVFNSLPTTAYVKMIDIWLIFNLFVPFSEVLLHTLIDSLREEEKRDINHHGKSISVQPVGAGTAGEYEGGRSAVAGAKIKLNNKKIMPGGSRDLNLVSRNEIMEVEARRRYYERLRARNERLLKFVHRTASVGLPLVFFAFVVVYFAVGFSYYYQDQEEL